MTKTETAANDNAGLRLATELGPLIAFLAAYWLSGVFVATGVFMLAIVGAVVVAKWKLGHVSPLLWF